MSNNDEIEKVRNGIERLYQLLLVRPQAYSRPVSIEEYIFAFELVLDFLSSADRKDSYRAFLRERRFGMHTFQSKFERDIKCTDTFILLTEKSDESARLESEYLDQFQLHWKEFLEWRKRE
jgi:hypothetical protein